MSAADDHPTGKPAAERLRIENRFWEKVDVAGEDECWEWQAYTKPDGYGLFYMGESDRRNAHRVACLLDEGVEKLPGTIDIRHQCHNKSCCNPAHLTPGSRSQNVIDSLRDEQVETKLSMQDVRDIREEYAGEDISQYDLADQYGVNQCTISAVIRREMYGWVD